MHPARPSCPAAFGVAAVALLSAPSAALADDIAIATSPDPVEEVTYQITVSGSTSSSERVYLTMKATGGQPCGANPAADDGDDVIAWENASGQFSFVRNRTTSQSGTYLLCAWVTSSSSATPTAVAQQVITVRVPRSAGSIALPGQVTAGSTFQMSVTTQTEVYRRLYVDINSPGVPCAANYAANRGWDDVFNYLENTGGPFTYTSNVTAPRAVGVYSVCGYIQEGGGDTVPEATFGAGFKVTSPRCPVAMGAQRRYQRQVRQLKRKLQGRSLRRGDRSPAVARVQRRLHIHADGVFGPKTERAVKRFQRRRGLVPSGIVDRSTRRALGLPPFISRSARGRYGAELRAVRRKLAKAKRDIDLYCE